MSNFSENLKKLRTEHNESQKDLADILNVSFQSVSKWENDINFPDILTLQLIAKHYNTTVDSLLKTIDVIIPKDAKSTKYDANINSIGYISVWTDFEYEGSIAPVSLNDKSRHRGNGFLPHHPGPKDTFVIGVDKKGYVCFLGEHINFGFPSCSPGGLVFENGYSSCYILGPKYPHNRFDFEFVIPKDGFIIVLNKKSLNSYRMIADILGEKYYYIVGKKSLYQQREHLFRDSILIEDIENCKVVLEDGQVAIYKEDTLPEYSKYDAPYEPFTKSQALEKRIDELEKRVNDLEKIIIKLQDEM